MSNLELNQIELKLQVLGQFASLSGSFQELPKLVLPFLLDLSELFDSQKRPYTEQDNFKKLQVVKLNADDERQDQRKDKENDKDQKTSYAKEEMPLDEAFQRLFASPLKELIPKALFLKLQQRVLQKAQANSLENEPKKSPTKTGFSNTEREPIDKTDQSRRIKPFVELEQKLQLYEKVFSPISSVMVENASVFLEAFAQPLLFSKFEDKLRKKLSKAKEKRIKSLKEQEEKNL